MIKKFCLFSYIFFTYKFNISDLAVGAPFEENGAVYIFLGSPGGLISEPSQRLAALNVPQVLQATHVPMMFGHGLSKGADFDSNGYPDLAIGAPNAEAAFVYRAYPVGQVIANIKPKYNEIAIGDTRLRVDACWKMATKSPLSHQLSNADNYFVCWIVLTVFFYRVRH